MTTPIDDMLTNLIEKLHAARFESAPPTNADLHEVAIALADTRLQMRGLPVFDDMRKADVERSIPVTAEQIATSTGDDLDERAEALGLSRKGWPYYDTLETDDALRTRCASALFGQTMTRELAEEVAKAALVARIGPRIDSETRHPPIASWVIDAVMSAAGAQPNGSSLTWTHALDARWRELDFARGRHDAAERTVVDQAKQITALRAEVKRLVELDGVKMTDAEVAALTRAT